MVQTGRLRHANSGLNEKNSGIKLAVLVRGKSNDAVVTKMPFVPAKYYKP